MSKKKTRKFNKENKRKNMIAVNKNENMETKGTLSMQEMLKEDETISRVIINLQIIRKKELEKSYVGGNHVKNIERLTKQINSFIEWVTSHANDND